jgi:outer membrane protein
MRFLTVLLVLGLPLPAAHKACSRSIETRDLRRAICVCALRAAGRIEKLPQGRALILPTLNLSANTLGSRFDANSHNDAIIPSFKRDFTQSGLTLTFTQPVYRPQNWLQYEQGELQVRQAEAVSARPRRT